MRKFWILMSLLVVFVSVVGISHGWKYNTGDLYGQNCIQEILSAMGMTTTNSAMSLPQGLTVNGNITGNGSTIVSNNALVHSADVTTSDDLVVGDDATVSDERRVDGDIDLNGDIIGDTANIVSNVAVVSSGDLQATDDLEVGDDADITGDLTAATATIGGRAAVVTPDATQLMIEAKEITMNANGYLTNAWTTVFTTKPFAVISQSESIGGTATNAWYDYTNSDTTNGIFRGVASKKYNIVAAGPK
jgi:hypothetical protein